LKAPFEFLSLQTAPGSFYKLHTTAGQGSLPKEPQPNRPPEPSTSRLTRRDAISGDVQQSKPSTCDSSPSDQPAAG